MKNKRWVIPGIVAIIVVSIISFAFSNMSANKEKEISENRSDSIIEPVVIVDDYLIEYENYHLESGRIKRGNTLGQILENFNIDPVTIHKIVEKMIDQDIFNPRYIKAGNPFHVYLSDDTLKKPQYFVYDITALDYLKINLKDSFAIERGQKEVTSLEKSAKGIISTSLWNTLQEQNISPELVIEMSEVLAWEVDFYRIQKGDRFKVIYREDYVGEESIGIDQIDAIYFMNEGREVYGYHFEKDTVHGYFDNEGENLRKVFLKAPLKFGRITSGYSVGRMHPILKVRRPHYGTDYAAPTGTPIYAVGDGVITERRYTSGNGYYIKMRHNSVYETQYLHMSRFQKGVTVGTRVKQGEVIGYVGETGLATGPHVCFRFWKHGKQVNHLKEDFPSADPMPESLFSEFSKIRDTWKQQLDELSFEDQLLANEGSDY